MLVLLAGAAAPRALAQTPTASRAPETPAPRQAATLGVGWYVATAGDAASGASDLRAGLGPYSDADALVTYARRGRRTSLELSAQSVLRYEPDRGGLDAVQHQGGFNWRLAGSRTTLRASQTVSYSPYYQFGGLVGGPGDPSAAAPDVAAQAHSDYAVAQLAVSSAATALDLSRTLSRRSAVSVSYGFRRTASALPELDLTAHYAGVRYTRALTRNAALRAGYALQLARYATFGVHRPRGHDIDFGLDYSRPLSFSRRTTVSFSTGSSALTEAYGTAYRVTADAALTRQIGRTWSGRLAFSRGLRLAEGISEPVFANALNVTLGGALTRRLTFFSSTGTSVGDVGSTATGRDYRTSTAAAGVRIDVSRRAAIETRYFYYRYHFADGVSLAPGLARELNRHGLRVGISWRAPLLNGRSGA